MKNLKDKAVVITGSGSGIGRALALKFAQEGCKLALNDFDEKALNETISMLESNEVYAEVFDVADKDKMNNFAQNVAAKFGKVDVVINNAGVALGKNNLMGTEYEDFEWVMNINFWGSVYGTKAFLPFLMEQNEASLVNISSLFGLIGVADQVAYCSSKFAIRGFTESLRMEMSRNNVTVSSVHPGGIQTNIAKNSKGWNENKDKDKIIRKMEHLFINTPEYAADIIINGIKNKKERILIGSDARIMGFLARVFPVFYTKILLRQLAKFSK